MKRLCVVLVWGIVVSLLGQVMGCNHGDLEVTPVFEGQPAPHDGFNVGPDTYVHEGEECKVGGMVIWVKGLDPNNLIRVK